MNAKIKLLDRRNLVIEKLMISVIFYRKFEDLLLVWYGSILNTEFHKELADDLQTEIFNLKQQSWCQLPV